MCGFLGSGKTTLLGRALGHPSLANAVVIVNEFGEVAIDHLVVADLAENVLELRNGCLCCTIRGDLALTLRALYHRRQLGDINAFDHVVVETSGLADPIPLAHTLMANPPLMKAFFLDAIICVVDAISGAATVDEHDTAANQVVLSDLIVVSKSDIAKPADLTRTLAAVARINPGAEVREVVKGEVDCGEIFGRRLFNPETRTGAIAQWVSTHVGHRHNHTYGTHTIVREEPLSLAGTSVFLNHVVNEQRLQMLRIKGLAGFREKDGAPALLHAVGDKFYPIRWLTEWPSTDRSSRLVFIGRDLDTEWLDAKFEALCN